jgi:hypothetical protein
MTSKIQNDDRNTKRRQKATETPPTEQILSYFWMQFIEYLAAKLRLVKFWVSFWILPPSCISEVAF